jgi:hypothetical protein
MVAASSPAVYELSAIVHAGRHFPNDSSFEVIGSFDAEESTTGIARASSSPTWGGSLVWRRDVEQIRVLQSQGAKLKLTGARARRDGSWRHFFSPPRSLARRRVVASPPSRRPSTDRAPSPLSRPASSRQSWTASAASDGRSSTSAR